MYETMTRSIRRVAICMSVAVGVFTLCAGQSFAAVVASEADNGKTVSVPLGQQLTVNLSDTNGSGYYWRLDADLTPELILSGRTTKTVDVPGAPETTTFVFTTEAAGTVTFKASYLKAGAPIPKTSKIAFKVIVTH